MSYAKSNPLFEFDIYRCQIDNSWNFFLSIFRWSFAIQLSNPEIKNYDDYLDGNYSSHEAHVSENLRIAKPFEDEIKAWYEEDSVEGEEHDDHDYHELEGIYYSRFSDQFIQVTKYDQDLMFTLNYEKGFPYADEKVVEDAIIFHIEDGTWEKVISP